MKKRTLLAALSAFCIGGAAIGLTACKDNSPAKHSHDWGNGWTVIAENKPTATEEGKATRTCTKDGCDATDADKEFTLPNLKNSDYLKSDDTATCSATGTITYTYNKNGVNVSFDIATEINANAHKYKYVKAETESEGHYQVCEHNGDHKTPVEAHDTNGTDGACSKCGYKPSQITHNWGSWTVTENNKPTKVKAGKATRSCTDTDCNVVDTQTIELPPLASISEYTVTDDTATCGSAGTATYTYKKNTSISFTAVSEAKEHNYGKATLIDGVPTVVCDRCHNSYPAELKGTISPGEDSAAVFAGGNLEKYVLSAYAGAPGYYTFKYTGEKPISVEYTYYSLKDGEITGSATLNPTGMNKFTVNLESRATCTIEITSGEETAFAGEITLEFNENDPSYVAPELVTGLTTVSATYEGVIYEFTAPVSGSYTLSCESEEAVILSDETAEQLTLPYTFTLAKDETISFAMCCNDETAEYDVQVGLNMSGSGTYADPYLITDDMLAVNVNAVLKNGETKYYKIAMQGNYLLNCLPVESKGTYPAFVADGYTAETFTSEIIIAEEKITVTGWKVGNITCGEDGFVFALTGSGNGVTDNVQLYVNYVYGSELNPANWLWYYFYYNAKQGFEIGDTIYVDFLARVSGRIDISTLNLSSVKLNGQVLATNGVTFEMIVTEGETYSFECVISADTTATYYIGTDVETEVTTVAPPTGTQIGTKFDSGSILLWFNHSEGTEKNPYLLEKDSSFEAYAHDNTYVQIEQSGKYTFGFTGLTATLNGDTKIVGGTQYKLVAGDKIGFVNDGNVTTVNVNFEANTGDITNPLLIAELQTGTFAVEGGAAYYVKADGASDAVFTFSGVTVTCNGATIISGTEFSVKDGDVIAVVNDGSAKATVNYTTTAVLGSENNPKMLAVDTAENVAEGMYFSLTLSGSNKYTVSISGVTALTVNGLNNMTMAVLPDVKYPLYSAIIEIDDKKYVFNSDGVLCTYVGNGSGVSVGYNGDKRSAFVATDDSKVLELKEGTYLLHVIKNPGALSVLETMAVDGTLTVTEKVAPPVTAEGSGTSADPFIVKEGVNTHTTTADDEFEGDYIGSEIQYLTFTANEKGTLNFSISDGATFMFPSKVSFTDALTAEVYIYPGEVENCSLAVEAGDVVYIIAGNADGAGEYSFNVEFVSSENGSTETPFTARLGANSGKTTEADTMSDDWGTYVHHYIYTADSQGTLTFTGTDTVILISKISFEDTANAEYYVYPGDPDSCSITVDKGDKVYILAGNANCESQYSFNIDFTATK